LRAFGLTLDFENETMMASGISKPMQVFPQGEEEPSCMLMQEFLDDMEMEDESNDSDDAYAQQEILDSKCDGATPKEIAAKCTHLTEDQRADLVKLFSKFTQLFDGKLRKFTDEQIHLEVDPSVEPNHSRACAVPHQQQEMFKKELQRPVAIGVLEKCGRADWVSGTFCVPKKDGRVRWVSDF
jgi:hypothetical protein